MERTQERAQEYEIADGVLRCTVQDLTGYYADSPARVLALFVAAAAKDCAVEADTYMAAMAAADAAAGLPAGVLRSAAQSILLSARPQAMGPLLAAGVFESVGLGRDVPCLDTLAKTPCTMETRWWRFLRLMRADYNAVCEKMGFSELFARTLAGMDRLAAMPILPKTMEELKMALSEEPDLDYGAFARAMEVEDPRWAGQAAMFDKLYRSGAPYRFDQLAISAGQLAVLGIRDQKAAWVVRKLLDAVIKTPELNSYPPLEMMARTLAQQYK